MLLNTAGYKKSIKPTIQSGEISDAGLFEPLCQVPRLCLGLISARSTDNMVINPGDTHWWGRKRKRIRKREGEQEQGEKKQGEKKQGEQKQGEKKQEENKQEEELQ